MKKAGGYRSPRRVTHGMEPSFFLPASPTVSVAGGGLSTVFGVLERLAAQLGAALRPFFIGLKVFTGRSKPATARSARSRWTGPGGAVGGHGWSRERIRMMSRNRPIEPIAGVLTAGIRARVDCKSLEKMGLRRSRIGSRHVVGCAFRVYAESSSRLGQAPLAAHKRRQRLDIGSSPRRTTPLWDGVLSNSSAFGTKPLPAYL